MFNRHEQIAKSRQRIQQVAKGILVYDVAKNTCQIGPMPRFDLEKEQFTGNRGADTVPARPHRRPFVVPKRV